MKRVLLPILMLLLCGTPTVADWGPWEAPTEGQKQAQNNTDTDPLQQAVKTFQKYISPVDGTRCPMYPTCSGYSRQALHKHGPFIGTMMTVDRLYRESDPIEQQDIIHKWGYVRYYDPLEKNDFWFFAEEEK